MRITLGIDSEQAEIDNTIDTISKLKFKGLEACDLVYVIESLGKSDELIGLSDFLDSISGSSYLGLQRKWAEDAIACAKSRAASKGLEIHTHIVSGQIANRLLEFSRQNDTNLLVLGSENKGSVESILIGSVTRKCIINSATSVLVCKNQLNRRPLKAVLATDHSAYANRCIDLLGKFAPQGLEEIVVTTVYPSPQIQKMLNLTHDLSLETNEKIEVELKSLNQDVISRLAKLNCRFSSRVEADQIQHGLRRVMVEEGADLLIMGAQGHGFSESILMGSVSLDLALTEPQSTLILRV